tara:strand:- start:17199 stop:18323 length:1125 start_codon:yes stop_codon:yes gene_type:complete
MKLNLDNGLSFNGTNFGANESVTGEVVFNTAMTGYVEALTDPSYKGQILVLTYPIQGSYGVSKDAFESKEIQVQGLIVANYNDNYSHYKAEYSLGEWLKAHNVPGITDIDTRSLTKVLRDNGTINGIISNSESSFVNKVDMANVLKLVVDNKVIKYTCSSKSNINILLIDTGAKFNIIRLLLNQDVNVIKVPWNMAWESYLGEVDGVFLANGPGDPCDAKGLIAKIKQYLFNLDIPVFGLCLGHQLLALASGAKINKLKYGNRSVNQPVKDLFTNKCYITSQNHGFAVDANSLNSDWQEWFVNLNDESNEGIKHKFKDISSVQFHPEAASGSEDTSYLFVDYINLVKQKINLNDIRKKVKITSISNIEAIRARY